MILRRRLALIEAHVSAIEANSRAIRLLLEEDDPPNVTRTNAADKSGPRSPLTSDVALANLKRMHGEARDAVDRERVRKIAATLAEQGYIDKREVDALEKP